MNEKQFVKEILIRLTILSKIRHTETSVNFVILATVGSQRNFKMSVPRVLLILSLTNHSALFHVSQHNLYSHLTLD